MPSLRTAALVGGVVAAIAGAIKTRRSTPTTSQTPPAPPAPSGPGVPPDLAAGGPEPAPAPANYDAPGPPANTATPLAATPTNPLDDPEPDAGLDEEAEVAAAAAEAAAIGGADPAYASTEASLLADEAERPLVESGQGESEGQDLAEAALLDEVTSPDGPGAGVTDAERQINQAIEDQENPVVGETPDVAPPGGGESGPIRP